MMRKIYVIRHGETDWNLEGKMQGQTDTPMNDTGRAQARRLALELKDALPFDKIVSSHLSRARETAEIIAESHNTAIHLDEGFSEMGFGEWEGTLFTDQRRKWPRESRAWSEDGDFRGPGGETVEGLIERVWTRFTRWADMDDYQKMAIVTHGSAGRALLCALIGEPARNLNLYTFKNTEYYVVNVARAGDYSIEDRSFVRRVVRK